MMSDRRTYDLQVHTDASPCSSTPPEEIVRAAIAAGLDGIAITDHDTMTNVAPAMQAAPDDFEIIPGVEITTSEGHLLAYNITDFPTTDNPVAVAKQVTEQGGITALSHPFDRFREHYEPRPALLDAVDAIEVINSRCLLERFNVRAKDHALLYDVAMIAGSDAHFPMEVGRARTVCRGSAIGSVQSRETRVEGRGRYVSGHVATKLYQFREALTR